MQFSVSKYFLIGFHYFISFLKVEKENVLVNIKGCLGQSIEMDFMKFSTRLFDVLLSKKKCKYFGEK